MKLKTLLLALLVLSLPLLNGCVTVVDAVTDRPIQPDQTKRSLGTYLDDKKLETVVLVNLRKAHPLLADANINAYSFNAVVLLTGEVPTNELRELADVTAREIQDVRLVYNELRVHAKRSFISNSTDTWLETKIKTKLIAYKDIESSRVKVHVEDHTVYLMGLLSHAQTEKITNVVKNTGGVRKVVRAIEYID